MNCSTDTYLVLAVDDDALMCDLYAAILQRARFDVAVAPDAAEARKRLSERSADLVLVDVQLNGSDGLQFAREMATQPQWRHIPVLALSATSDVGVEDRARESGCTGFIRKPINPRTFAEEVSKYLLAARARSRSMPKVSDEAMRRMKHDFVLRSLQEVADLQARNDQELLADNLLVKVAHRWAGASGLEGLPDVLSTARSLEALATSSETGRIVRIRKELERVNSQYRAELPLGSA